MRRRLGVAVAACAAVVLLFAGCDQGGDGSSCHAVQMEDGSAVLECDDGSTAVIEPPSSTVFDNPAAGAGDQMACTVTPRDEDSMVIACPDGSEFVVRNGENGSNGQDGQDGISCAIVEENGDTILRCADGSQAVIPDPEDLRGQDGLDGQDGAPGTDGQDGQDGTPGTDGQDGTPGADGTSCTIVQENGQTILRCTDGTEAVLATADDPVEPPPDPDQPPAEQHLDDLTAEDLAEVDVLRDAIEQGLTVGEQEYIQTVTVGLQSAGVLSDYESTISEGWSNTAETISSCPFVENYANGFTPDGANCDFLVELARLDTYADLTEALEDAPLPAAISQGQFAEAAGFWYEQGAVSGIEQRRVMVRADLRMQRACSTTPTPNEGAYDKGYTVGSLAMAQSFNTWLAANGHTPDYPAMTNPINVCNMGAANLDPARQSALANLATTLDENPLCTNYVPPTQEHAVQYSQAVIQYQAGVRAGIDAEFALAAVRIFRVVPCVVYDPLVVDLDGDGLELLPVYRGVNFDMYAVGDAQAVAWVAPDDGLLVMDRNSDGQIGSGAELFGTDRSVADGFAHLATLDENGDGVVSAADSAWASLSVWRDANTDGVSSADELLSLSAAGLTAIPVTAGEVSLRSEGVRIPALATAQGTKGDVLVGDALLQTAPWASPSL